jgi:tripartite-type tricarboxylate transporter receptor subunit TctC
VTGEQRARALPDVPTVRESGLSGYVVASWNALAAPAKTPPDVVARLNRDLNAALSAPDAGRRLRDLNVEPRPGTPAQASTLLQSEVARWGAVITKAGIPRE